MATHAVLYFALRAFAVPAATRALTTLALMWVYILVADAPPSAIRAGMVARSRPCTVRTDNGPRVRFSARVGEELEVQLGLV